MSGFVRLPVAGTPVRLPAMLVPHDRVRAFRVEGDALAEDDIFDGDYVLADPDLFIAEGDIAVIRLGDRQVVKRLRYDTEPLEVVSDYAFIGKVIRRFRLM